MGHSKSSSKKEVYSDTILPQETRKISNKQPNLTPKATRETGTNKTQSQKREKKIKIRAERSKIEMKKTTEKNNKTKS